MKVNEIAAGKKVDIHTNEEGQLIELINTNCSEALASFKEARAFLYRGAQVKYDVFHGRPRENRRSLSMLNWQQEVFDKAMDTYGFTALRSNSIFCSGNINQASSYGKTFMIFPINGFSFLWSSKIRDFVLNAYEIGESCKLALKSRDVMGAIQNKVINIFDYSNENLVDAIYSNHEVLIHGEYYAFSHAKYYDLLKTVLLDK
jgi:hypothetical protein